MRIHVEFTVYADARPLGQVRGYLTFAELPREGEDVHLDRPAAPVRPPRVLGFDEALRIERVRHIPLVGTVTLTLARVELAAPEDAAELFAYLREGFGLGVQALHRPLGGALD